MSELHWFAGVLRAYPRVAISGGPRTGKSWLAATVTDRPVLSTDDFQRLRWADVPAAVIAEAMAMGDRWVVEGVQVARALRKGLPADVVVHLTGAYGALTTGQAALAKGVETWLRDWINSGASVTVIRREGL